MDWNKLLRTVVLRDGILYDECGEMIARIDNGYYSGWNCSDVEERKMVDALEAYHRWTDHHRDPRKAPDLIPILMQEDGEE